MACYFPILYPRYLNTLLVGILVALAGCDRGPKVYPVQGKVVNKGKGHLKDLTGYNIQLQSVTEPGEMPGGRVEEDGTFTLYTRVGGKVIAGVKEGTYQACLLPPILEGVPSPPLLIPARYTKFETSKLQYDIKPGPNTLTIEVERGTR